MTTVKVGENETLESALKRFKRKCQKDGIIGDIRKKKRMISLVLQRKRKEKPLAKEHVKEVNL